MKKIYYVCIAFCLFIAGPAFYAGISSAQSAADIKYPVEELGGCKSEADCKIYCDKPANMDACLNFAQKNNLMTEEELAQAKKFLAAGAEGPGGCSGKEECEAYCNNINHINECLAYAQENGLMTPEELAEAKKVQEAIKRGVKPPPCKGKEECDAYCRTEEHIEECINFSVAAGMMSEEDAEMAKKTKGRGPGGCMGKEECETFCNNPDNQETCFKFAADNGMIPEEELKKMEEGKQQTKQMLNQATTEVIDCLNSSIGADMVEKMRNGFMPPRDVGNEMQTCFQKMGGPKGMGPGEGGDMPPQAGPGGCKTPEECKSYCESNQEECKNFYPAGDQGAQEPGPNQPGTQMPPEGQMTQGQPCEGDGCQMGPLPGQPMQPGQEFLPEQNMQPPSGEPGSGGSLIPGEQVPLAPPTQQTPPEPGSFIINTDSFVGSLIYAAFKVLVSPHNF